ncbi:MAG: ribonuclease VapC [Candidatus Bathyarchaeota archaeon]|nr:ribonuclease VapC [Candidatus Bathyarchaeota archaeon]
MGERRTIVLDTSAFIAGFNPSAVDGDIYSVPAVGEELSEGSLAKLRFNAAVEGRRLKVWEPSPHYLNRVKESSKEIGDILFLSEADKHILALALQLKADGCTPTIATDDYSIQNVARKIEVGFAPLTTFGIRFHLHWLLYCPACRKKYPSDYSHEQCEICGTRLKRKPTSKSPIKKADES